MTDGSTEPGMIEQSVRIDAPPEAVWSFWTDPARLCRWWGVEAEVVPEPGGTFRVVMGDGPVMRGTFIELSPPSRLVFSFGWEHNQAGEPLVPGSTRVEVTLTGIDGGTLVLLRHTGMPAMHALDHREGWAYFVGRRLVDAVAAAA